MMSRKKFLGACLIALAILALLPRTASAGEMKIFVKDATGKSFTLDVAPTDTILTVKQKLQDKTGVPPDQQRIVRPNSTRDLEDAKTLADYKVQSEATLHLLKRLRGG
jgi:ubiquitin